MLLSTSDVFQALSGLYSRSVSLKVSFAHSVWLSRLNQNFGKSCIVARVPELQGREHPKPANNTQNQLGTPKTGQEHQKPLKNTKNQLRSQKNGQNTKNQPRTPKTS